MQPSSRSNVKYCEKLVKIIKNFISLKKLDRKFEKLYSGKHKMSYAVNYQYKV